jgi:hypothetical protein
MQAVRMRKMAWWVAGAAAAAVALPVVAQNGADAPPLRTMLAWEHQAPSTWFPSEKDAGLVRAGAMLPERLREVFELEEFADMRRNVPWPLVEMALARLGGSMRFIATQQGFDPNTGAPQLGVVLSFGLPGGAEEGAQMHMALEQLRAQFGHEMQIQPSQRFAGMNEAQLPFGKLAYGPREAPDGHRYEFHFGAAPDPDTAFANLPGGEGQMDVIARGVLDLSAAAPFTAMGRGMMGMLGDQGRALEQTLAGMGLFGEDAIAVEYACGFTDTHGIDSVRVRRAGPYADGLGLSRLTISQEDLAVIPADASFAWVMKSDATRDLDRLMAQMRPFLQAQGMTPEELFVQIKGQTGIDVPAIISAFGDTAAFYLSDSTGGGGLLSGVFVAKLADEAKAQQAMAQLAGIFNDAVAGQIDTRAFAVRLTPFEHDGVRYLQLRTPGLPVPLEPTIATAGEWLVAGLTAPAAAGAVRQIREVSSSLASSDAFRAEDVPLGRITELMFIDSQRTVRDGYGAVGMFSSALANLVRSPLEQRDPGLICPPYAELVEDVRPLMMISYWDEDDYLTRWSGDRSTLVNGAAVLGVGDLGSFIGGALLGSGASGGMQRHHRPAMWEVEEIDDDPDF